MPLARSRPFLTAALVAGLGLAPATAFAQQSQRVESGSTVVVGPNAELTRQELIGVLKQYPPSLGRLLRLDPNLMSNEQFLQPYPNLVAFLTKHPEIKRSPEYYFSQLYGFDGGSYRSETREMWEMVMAGVGVFVMVVTMLFAIAWVVRTLVDYRRWHRLSKTQAEAHAKLLDRFTANAELLAYVQSPAGARFLQSAPIALDPGPRSLGAPFSRILWSLQAGLVLAAAGFGLYYASGRVDEEMIQPIFTLGVVALSLGAGFVVSAIVSFVLSKQLGLFDQSTASTLDRRDSMGA